MPWVRTKINPDELIFVSEAAHADLASKGLLLGQFGGEVPPDPDDTRLARYLRESSSATRAELQVLLGDLVGAEVGAAAAGVQDPLVAALIAASGSDTRVQLEAASVAAVGADLDSSVSTLRGKVGSSKGEVATLAPLYVETLTTGLVHTTPANIRTGLGTATYTQGGYTQELAIAVTGTKGSKVLTSTETAKVAGLGSTKFEAALNATDGSSDLFATVVGNNGSTQINLLRPLPVDFTGTLTPKYADTLSQHLSAGATKAYAQHAASVTGLVGSRGRILAGVWDRLPPKYNTLWKANAALLAYGVQNSAAPVVASGLVIPGTGLSIISFDGLAQRPVDIISGVRVGTHTAGHGAEATLYPGRRDAVLTFWTGAYRTGASLLGTTQLTITVKGDGVTLYAATHDATATRVVVPVHGADRLDISVTNADGGIYNLDLTQLQLREAGVGGAKSSRGKKIVTLGDSWFAYYDGLFARTLAAKTGTEVIARGKGGMTTDWGLAWFDTYVLAEQPDECWIHFFTNDSNNTQAITFAAPDGSTQFTAPQGMSSTAALAYWQGNILKLIERCRAAGIKPVVMMPGGTASDSQTQRHTNWHWALDLPAPVDWSATPDEIADPAAYINTIGKVPGAQARVGQSRRYATGPAAADAWRNPVEDGLIAVQRETLHLSTFTLPAGVVVGTDTDADGLSDGLTTMPWGTNTGDTHVYSVASGLQVIQDTYGATATGNTRVRFRFTPTAGTEYLVVFDIIDGPASVTMDFASDLTGTAVLPVATMKADGTGVAAYRATATSSTQRYAAVAMPRNNGGTRDWKIRKAFVVDMAALTAAAPGTASMSMTDLTAFLLALQP